MADSYNIYIKIYVKEDAESESGIKKGPTALVFDVFDFPVFVKKKRRRDMKTSVLTQNPTTPFDSRYSETPF